MFRHSLRRLAAHPAPTAVAAPPARTRVTTTIHGLAIHHSPFPHLVATYNSTLHLLQSVPEGALYRRSVESIIHERLDIIKKFGGDGAESDITAVEDTIGLGCVEELIVMAESELKLAGKMLEWKAWEDLEVKPMPGQWEQFGITASTSTSEDLEALKLK